MINFRNSAPYRLAPPAIPVTFLAGTPTELARQMAFGNLDACLLPIAALHLAEGCSPLGAFGIAAEGHVLSVLLFSKQPLAKIVEERRSVFITPTSVTTRVLFKTLCRRQFGANPRIADERGAADAAVLIGDEALDHTLPEYRWPVVQDIAQWWYESTRLPFVFARWIARDGLERKDIEALVSWLDRNIDMAATDEGRRRLREVGASAGWSSALTDLYYERLRFRLKDRDLQGLAEFQQLLKQERHDHATSLV
jgi:chorismate dehydratase